MNESTFFVGGFDAFKKDFEALCEKYGYHEHFCVIGEMIDEEVVSINGFHSEIDEGLLDYIQEAVDDARETIDD